MFEGFRIGLPILFLKYCTMLLGGLFLVVAWGELVFRKKSKGLYIFTSSVLLNTILVVYNAPSAVWVVQHEGLWTFVVISTVSASFVLDVITLVLTFREPGILKIGSGALLVTNLLGFTWLICNTFQ